MRDGLKDMIRQPSWRKRARKEGSGGEHGNMNSGKTYSSGKESPRPIVGFYMMGMMK